MAKKVASTTKFDEEEVSVQQPHKEEQISASENESEEPQPRQDIPVHADRILRTFSNYPELYIDFQGGTFTVDTPPAFRSNATRYRNPYYKS